MLIFEKELIDHMKKKNESCIKVESVKGRAACCIVMMPKVTLGIPKDLKGFDVLEQDGYTVYIDSSFKYNDDLRFTYSTLLFKEMIEVHGIELERGQGF